MAFLRSFIIAICLGILAGCSFSAPVNSEVTGPEKVGITNGTKAGLEDPIAKSTVILSLPGGASCTGVLLSEQVVLTAAHCVAGLRGSESGFTALLPEVHSSYSCMVSLVTDISFPTNAVRDSSGSYFPDLALLKLKTALCTPPKIVLDPTPQIDDVVTAAGFGLGTTPGRPDHLDLRVISSDKADLKKLYQSEHSEDASLTENWKYLESYYDEYSKYYLFALPSVSEQSLCKGDSGGTVYREQKGVLHLVGINGAAFPHSKKGALGCDWNYVQLFTPLGPSMAWIKNTLANW